MKKFTDFLTERDESDPNWLSQKRNTLDVTPKPFISGGVRIKPGFKSVSVYTSPLGEKGKYYVISKDTRLMLDAGEWWARFDEMTWDGASLKPTGKATMLALGPIDRVNGVSPASLEGL